MTAQDVLLAIASDEPLPEGVTLPEGFELPEQVRQRLQGGLAGGGLPARLAVARAPTPRSAPTRPPGCSPRPA